jgi:UDPglucose 6-dehydrogenase
MKIAMIGSGYVGLVSGSNFADFGHDVVCVDHEQGKIDSLRAGTMPIYEPGLEALVARNLAAGRLSFSTDLPSSLLDADAVFIAVGTPSQRGDGFADLSYVQKAALEIG